MADLQSRLTVLHEKCNCSQCCITTHIVDLFIHAVKYFAVHLWAGKQPTALTYDRLLNNAKS